MVSTSEVSDVLKAGFWVFCSPPFSSLTGTRESDSGLGEAEVDVSWETTTADLDSDVPL